MSLINKMLLDLEARSDHVKHHDLVTPAFADLRAAGGRVPLKTRPWRIIVAIIAGILILSLAYTFNRSNHRRGADTQEIARRAEPKMVASDLAAGTPQQGTPKLEANRQDVVTDKGANNIGVAEEIGDGSPWALLAKSRPQAARNSVDVAAPVARTGVAEAANARIATRPHDADAASSAQIEPYQAPAAPPPAAHKISSGARTKAPVIAPKKAANAAVAKVASAAVQIEQRQDQNQHPGEQEGAVDKKNYPLTPDETAENTFRGALNHLKQGQNHQAETELKAALTLNARQTKAREVLVGLLLDAGRWPEAQVILGQGISAEPAYYPFAQLSARLYVDHGADAKAVAVLVAARMYGQKDPDFLGFLATLYQRTGQYQLAVNTYRNALDLRQDGKWWLGLGISLEAQKAWPEAQDAYTRAKESGDLTPALGNYADQRLTYLKDRSE